MYNLENGHERIPTLIAYSVMVLVSFTQIVFLILKLTNVIDWNWIIVCLPILITSSILCLLTVVVFIVSRIRILFNR